MFTHAPSLGKRLAERVRCSAKDQVGPKRAPVTTVRSVEQLVTVADLRITVIFDFQPRGCAPVGPIGAMHPLSDDAFQIQLTRSSEQIRAAYVNVIETQQPTVHDRHDAQESTLAVEQRQAGQILPVDAEDVEAVKERPLATEQQLLEIGAAVKLQAADFTVEHASKRPNGVREFLGELRPVLERVPVAGGQLAAMPTDIWECPEAVQCRFEHEPCGRTAPGRRRARGGGRREISRE